jgi:hypothetical protein
VTDSADGSPDAASGRSEDERAHIQGVSLP